MHALMKKENDMSVEERLASLESDTKHLRTGMAVLTESVKSLDGKVQALSTEFAKEFGSVRADTNKEFGLLRAEHAGYKADTNEQFRLLRADMNKEFGLLWSALERYRAETKEQFGSVRVSIESLKTSIEKAKLWMLVTGGGVILSTVVTLAHALKLF